MAQKVSIILVDDIDGSEADETVRFGLDGTNYEIDLNAQHAQELRDTLATYVGHARKSGSGGRRGGGRGRSTNSSGPSAADIRAWGRENGYDVPERGRIPAELREAYDSAN
ncbi:histone-like nucleoid-structuring protein Lsr2 [Nocardioides massiliensis]|uniref:Lsr2 family protein n=1 Tax=Nocardioides massiliensis TaxID=1325935 RepID=A0ABT9NP29_9ACTN|nr:Lsr2 family protein [Nocardioides massiliensis]MDP9821615.1 hypothetical protein [Nocardioides massiliensis]